MPFYLVENNINVYLYPLSIFSPGFIKSFKEGQCQFDFKF